MAMMNAPRTVTPITVGKSLRPDRLDRQLPDPWQAEDGLGDECPAEQEPTSSPSIVTTGVSAPRSPCL